MSTTLAEIVNTGMVIVNASTVWGTNDDPKKWPARFLDLTALRSDAETCRLVCTPHGHPLQKGFTASTSALADGAVIAVSGGGEIFDVLSVKVDNVDARRKPVTYFKRLQSDPLSRTSIGKYYDIEGANIIRHNGTSAILQVVRFLMTGAPQAPDSLFNATVACFCAMISSKMGVDVGAASYFAQQWAMRQQTVLSGEVTVSPVVAYQRSEQQ